MNIVGMGRNHNIYDIGNGQRRLIVGGDIYNPAPFDGGVCAPFTMLWEDGVPQGNWRWFGKGEQGYLIKPSTGTVRIYPVKGDTTKYIQVSGMVDTVCQVNQIDNKNLELYIDQTYTRWSLKMGPQGFKPEILLKPGWTGTPEWSFRFELNGGLKLIGAWICDADGTRLLKMQNPFIVDANGDIFPVSESLANGVATLTTSMDGVVLPAIVDPTLSGNPDKDTHLVKGTPVSGFGQATVQRILSDNAGGGNWTRALIQKDISAIPATATVTSAIYSVNITVANLGSSNATTMYRLIVTNWEDAGINTLNAEANYDNYKDPFIPWPGGVGGLGDSDATVKDTIDVSTVAIGAFNFNVINTVSDAVANRSGIWNVIYVYDNEMQAPQARIDWSSLEAAANKPTLTVDYTVSASLAIPRNRIVNLGLTGPQNRSTIANA